MVLFETLSNNILVEPMQSRVSGEMCHVYQTLVDRLNERGIKPTIHILDNRCSAEFKTLVNENEMKYQSVPPNDHRRNVAEKKNNTNFQRSLYCGVVRHGRQLSVETLVLDTAPRRTPT